MLVIGRNIRIPGDELRFQFARSSGPGGQNVNKLSTKAVLRWRVRESPSLAEGVRERFCKRFRRRLTRDGELVLASQRYRSQRRNVADCLDKLQAMIAEVARPPRPRRPTRPGRQARERRLCSKRAVSEKKRLRRRARSDG